MHEYWILLNSFFYKSYVLCICYRIASSRRFLQISKTYVFLKSNNEKNTRSADFCADRIDVITDFVVITNVVIKRVHCTKYEFYMNFVKQDNGTQKIRVFNFYFLFDIYFHIHCT